MMPLDSLEMDAYMKVGETVSTMVLLPLSIIIRNRGRSPFFFFFFLLTTRSSLLLGLLAPAGCGRPKRGK